MTFKQFSSVGIIAAFAALGFMFFWKMATGSLPFEPKANSAVISQSSSAPADHFDHVALKSFYEDKLPAAMGGFLPFLLVAFVGVFAIWAFKPDWFESKPKRDRNSVRLATDEHSEE